MSSSWCGNWWKILSAPDPRVPHSPCSLLSPYLRHGLKHSLHLWLHVVVCLTILTMVENTNCARLVPGLEKFFWAQKYRRTSTFLFLEWVFSTMDMLLCLELVLGVKLTQKQKACPPLPPFLLSPLRLLNSMETGY